MYTPEMPNSKTSLITDGNAGSRKEWGEGAKYDGANRERRVKSNKLSRV